MMTLETKEGLFALMEQIAGEREAARPIVEKLVASGESMEDIEIPDGWRTAGMVMELADAAYAKNESRPRQSLALSEVGFAIATSISNTYPELIGHYLYGRALREIGYAQRYLDAYDASLRAFGSSERAFAHDGALLHDQAVAQYAGACVLYRAARYDDALALLASSEEVFHSFGDEGRKSRCRCLDAAICHERGDLSRARLKYEALLDELRTSNDLATSGAVCQNLGALDLDLGRSSDAAISFARARSIFMDLDAPCEISRADWGLAQVFLIEGQPKKALPLLWRVRQDYLSRCMPAAAAEIGLHIVDALVMMDQIDEAKAINQQVLRECVDHKLNQKAIMALSYLREILQTTANPRRAIQHVRSYVQRLRSEPQLLFAPLDEGE